MRGLPPGPPRFTPDRCLTLGQAGAFPRQAMVFAAGRGERLGALTARRAKPALPFCGIPLLSRLLAWLAAGGVEEVAVNLHQHPETLEPLLRESERVRPGLRIQRSPEPELLGTSGGLSRAAARFRLGRDPARPLLVMNGDTLPTFDLAELAAYHAARGGEATLLCDPDPGPAFAGERRLETDGSGTITGLGPPGSRGFGFAGVWLLDPAALRHLTGGPGGLSRDLLVGLIAAGTGRAFPSDAPWFEIGTPRRYLEASLGALADGVFRDVPDDRNGLRPVRFGTGATGAPAELIGAGSVLEEGARVERSVLLEEVRVGAGAVVRDSVVAEAERVPPGTRIQDALFVGGAPAPL